MPEILLECEHVSHWFGQKKVLYDVNLQIMRGQIVGLVGPSGSGKSTLLHAILGTHPPRAGQILMDGRPYTRPHRDRGIVYQRYSLFPFHTAEENVALGLMLDQTTLPFRCFQLLKWKKIERQFIEQGRQLLSDLGLEASCQLYPDQMSGGMRQRVAIAQALVMRPKILLLDEPFGALDEATREELQILLLKLYQENLKAIEENRPPPYTIMIVTHEINEAIYVGDRVIGLSQYHNEGSKGATIVYDKPAPIFSPLDARDYTDFAAQKDEILKAVFDEHSARNRSEYVTFWRDFMARTKAS